MENQTFQLNWPKEASKWLEMVKKKDLNREIGKDFGFHRLSLSPCGRFSFFFPDNDGFLKVFDTYHGISTNFKFVENKELTDPIVFDLSQPELTLNGKLYYMTGYSARVHNPLHYFATSPTDGVLFWDNVESDDNDDQIRSAFGSKLFAAKFQLDYNEMTYKQISETWTLENLCGYWISQLVPHKSVILATRTNFVGVFQSIRMQKFDLHTLEFSGPIALFELHNEHTCFLPTFYKECFYYFKMDTVGQIKEENDANRDYFMSINCYDVRNDNDQRQIWLRNDLAWLLSEFEMPTKFIGNWHSNYLYLQITRQTLVNELLMYTHNFAILNLDTLSWAPIVFASGNDSNMLTSYIPMAMSISNEEQMVFVKSLNLLDLQPRKYCYTMNSLLPYSDFIDVGGHAHCSSRRIALRRPVSFMLLTLQSTNKKYPKWKDTNDGKLWLNNGFKHKPLFEQDPQHQVNPCPIKYTTENYQVCNECDLKSISTAKSYSLHSFLDFLYSHSAFVHNKLIKRLLFVFIVMWLFVQGLNFVDRSDNLFSNDAELEEIFYNYCQDVVGRKDLWCIIFNWTGVRGSVAGWISSILSSLFIYVIVFFVLCVLLLSGVIFCVPWMIEFVEKMFK